MFDMYPMYKDDTVRDSSTLISQRWQAPFSPAFRATAVTSLVRAQRANLKSAI